MTDPLDRRPALHPAAAVERVGGRLMIATRDDKLHLFAEEDDAPNEVGERIVDLVDGRRSVREIASVIGDEFDVDSARALADTAAFIELLVERQVLALPSAGPQAGRTAGQG